MEILLFALGIPSVVIFLLWELRKQRIKDSQPTYSYQATIRGKRPGEYLRNGKLRPGNLHSCVITFELSSGTLISLNTTGAAGGYPIGTSGTIIFQGEKCERFDPDK
jgi:hypothetical protein